MIIHVNSQFNTDNSHIDTNITNIDYLANIYELTYDNSSVLKAFIITVNDIETNIEFNTRLISEKGKNEYKLLFLLLNDKLL